jgi:hypothetical protein
MWCDVRILDPEGAVVRQHHLAGTGHPDLCAVDWVARIRLEALRQGQTVEVVSICPDLAALLAYIGL